MAELTYPKRWLTFFNKCSQIDVTPIHDWKPLHLLGYFMKKYEAQYGVRYSFDLSKAPGQTPEMFFVKRMFPMLGTSNPKTVKDYIDWFFEVKVSQRKAKIRTINALGIQGIGNEFLLAKAEKEKIRPTTVLPSEYQSVVDSLSLPVSTYGDLVFAKKALDEAPELRKSYKELFDKLRSIGFEMKELQELMETND